MGVLNTVRRMEAVILIPKRKVLWRGFKVFKGFSGRGIKYFPFDMNGKV